MAAAVTNFKLLLLCSAGIAAQTAALMMLTRKLALHLRGYVLIYANGRLSPVTKPRNKISKSKSPRPPPMSSSSFPSFSWCGKDSSDAKALGRLWLHKARETMAPPRTFGPLTIFHAPFTLWTNQHGYRSTQKKLTVNGCH